MQKELDNQIKEALTMQLNNINQIKEALEKYLNNPSNSVSGSNFNELVLELELIQARWQGHCKEYFNKIGKP